MFSKPTDFDSYQEPKGSRITAPGRDAIETLPYAKEKSNSLMAQHADLGLRDQRVATIIARDMICR
jgi:hypothetical protein